MIKLLDEKQACTDKFLSEYIPQQPHYREAFNKGWNACLAEVKRLNATTQPVSDGWVKCSERMPDDAQWCLVYTDYGQFAQCWSSNTNRGWLGDEISIPNIDVTHWMPLPAAPGGKDD